MFQFCFMALLYYAALMYVGGNRLTRWVEEGIYPLSERIFFHLPWKRKRMERDFTAMLAILLDTKTPEDRAVQLAAQTTANCFFIKRAELAMEKLREGERLPEAIRELDNNGELQWRLTNACHSGHGFSTALAGWLEILDARAFQEEQAAAQFVTTGLVIIHGLMVAYIVAAFMQCILGIGIMPVS